MENPIKVYMMWEALPKSIEACKLIGHCSQSCRVRRKFKLGLATNIRKLLLFLKKLLINKIEIYVSLPFPSLPVVTECDGQTMTPELCQTVNR